MFESIVVGTDGSATSRGAVEKAATLAKLTGAEVHLVRAYRLPSLSIGAMAMPDAMPATPSASDSDVTAEVEAELATIADRISRDGLTTKTYACASSSAADAILDVAEHQKADLIVVGNKGLRGVRRVLGSVPNTVVREATCAVMVVHTT